VVSLSAITYMSCYLVCLLRSSCDTYRKFEFIHEKSQVQGSGIYINVAVRCTFIFLCNFFLQMLPVICTLISLVLLYQDRKYI